MAFAVLGVLRIVIVATVLIGCQLDSPWWALVPIGLLIIYFTIGLRETELEPARLELLGEKVYFAGYLATIASLVGILVRLRLQDGRLDRSQVIVVGAFALGTTLFGLIAMAILKDWAEKRALLVRPEPVPAHASTSNGTEALASAEVQRLLTESIEGVRTAVEEVKEKLKELKTATSSLAGDVDLGAFSAKQFTENVQQLGTVIDQFVRLCESKLEPVEDAPGEDREVVQ